MLWGCPVVEAQARCDSREFAEWLAFFKLRGASGDMRGDFQAGIVASAVVRAMTGKYIHPSKFMPRFDGRPDMRELIAKLRHFATVQNSRAT